MPVSALPVVNVVWFGSFVLRRDSTPCAPFVAFAFARHWLAGHGSRIGMVCFVAGRMAQTIR